MKKPLLPISIFVFFLLFSPFNISASQHEKAGDTLSGGRCETLGQVAQVCIGARDYQIFECKRAAEDDCQGILDRKEKLANSCNDCIPGVVGWLVETCEGRESQRTTAEFETQCTGPLKQLDEEYSKCRQTYAWKATGKGSCSVEGMVCSPQTTAGRRFDVCRPGPDAYKDTAEQQTGQEVKPQEADDNIVSLINEAPAKTDLQPVSSPSKPTQKPLTGVVVSLDGNVDMKLSDGSWVAVKEGDVIPAGAKVFVGYDSTVDIKLSDNLEVIFRSLEEVDMQILQTNPEVYRTELKLEDGALRFKVLEGTIKTDMRVSTPRAVAAVVGTDFGVKYDPKSETSIFEIYDGTIEVQNNITGEKKTLTSAYGSPIKRLEVNKDNSMVEKTAIPKNQKRTKIPVWIYAGGIAVLAAGVVLFIKRKTVFKGSSKKKR